MSGDFLGVGWTSPVRLDEDGRVVTAKYEDCVYQSIWTILSTAKGERLMRPDFGCGIHDLVFASNSAATIGEIVSEVTESLIEWEPRIDVLNVDVYGEHNRQNQLLIQINYKVRSTNNRFNLVYPFYLG
ncbi:GPW/gp25 family protein [Limnofasciculus baicalensis]